MVPPVIRTASPHPHQLDAIAMIGGLLGIKTASLLARLEPLAGACGDDLVVIVPHGFDELTVATHVTRAQARPLCGAWLDELVGDRLRLEIGATSCTAFSDEAALPPGAPAIVDPRGDGMGMDELVALGTDGATWTYVLAQPHGDPAASAAAIARNDRVAETMGVTPAQRRVGGNLQRSLARGLTSRVAVRARDGVVEPRLALAWDRVEWLPIESMLAGFHPTPNRVEHLHRLARAVGRDEATLELVLGTQDPPALRIAVRVAGP